MRILYEFLDYCNANLARPMFEAIGRAYTTLFKPALLAMFEAAAKRIRNPRDATRDVVQEYIVSRNGGDANKALATVGAGGNTTRAIDLIEKNVLEFIQRYGRTGEALRQNTSQKAYERVVLRVGGKLATAISKYEPGVARILLEDIHALRLLCGNQYDAVCKATGIRRGLGGDVLDERKFDNFRDIILPTLIRHNALTYVQDGSNEWKPFPNVPVMDSDFSFTSPKTKETVTLHYDDMVEMCKRFDEPMSPSIGDVEGSGNLPVAYNSSDDSISGTYDIYYIPTEKLLEEFCSQFREPMIYVKGFSRWHVWDHEEYGPWCLAGNGWSSHIGHGSSQRSVYVCLKKGWEKVPVPSETTAHEMQWDDGGEGTELDKTCICILIEPNGRVKDCCGRADYEWPAKRLSKSSMCELLQTNSIEEAMPWMGAEGTKLTRWLKITKNGSGGIARPTPEPADDDDQAIIRAINNELSDGFMAQSDFTVGEKRFIRDNGGSVDSTTSAMNSLKECGHRAACYYAVGGIHTKYFILIIDDREHPYILGNRFFSDVKDSVVVGSDGSRTRCIRLKYEDGTSDLVNCETLDLMDPESETQNGDGSTKVDFYDYIVATDGTPIRVLVPVLLDKCYKAIRINGTRSRYKRCFLIGEGYCAQNERIDNAIVGVMTCSLANDDEYLCSLLAAPHGASSTDIVYLIKVMTKGVVAGDVIEAYTDQRICSYVINLQTGDAYEDLTRIDLHRGLGSDVFIHAVRNDTESDYIDFDRMGNIVSSSDETGREDREEEEELPFG